MKYYFFVASLPMLLFGKPPGLTFARFRALCGEHLSDGDLAVLDGVTAVGGPCGGHPFARRWRNADVQLRNAVAKARAARAGRDAAPYLRAHEGFDVYAQKAVADAFGRATPLERERELDRFRWATLEELAGSDPFEAEAVFAYALKLRIAERWARLDEKGGRAALAALVDSQARV